MAIPGQPDPDRSDRPVVATSQSYKAGGRAPRHRHRRGQIIFLIAGAMRIETDAGLWLAPPGRAAWVPGNTFHSARYTTNSSICIAYIDGNAFSAQLPQDGFVFALTGLLRELVLRAVDLGWSYPMGGREERAMRLLVDELVGVRPLGLHLPLGRDPRLRRIVDALIKDPGDTRPLNDWARDVGASERTIARLFKLETNFGFSRWREQLRLTRAIEMLSAGRDITRTALDLGYSSPSSFSTMFSRAMGHPPRAYMLS